MASEVQLTSLYSLANGIDLHDPPKMVDCIETQFVGHDPGPVIAFADLLELGADCTVLGDDYINERDVFNDGAALHNDTTLSSHRFQDECNGSGSHNNNNSLWFNDEDSDFTNILNTVDDAFAFEDNILFETDYTSTNALNYSSSSCSDVTIDVIQRDPVTHLFQCPHCIKSFQYSSRLQRHLTVHQSKQYRCRICDKYFSRVDVMEAHIARSHKSGPSSLSPSSRSNSSSEVDDWSSDKGPQRKRNFSLSSDQRFSCSECPAMLASRHHLERHQRSHQNKVGDFFCQKCEKSFSVKHKFQMHMRQHMSDRKFKCSECGQGFLQAEFLSRHLLTHSKENPFKCTDCDKAFKQLVNLKQHQLRKHQKLENNLQKRHPCNQCDKVFLTSSELKNHTVYHANVRRYPCTACDSAFIEKRHLDRHLRRIHSGIKNFFCNMCGKAFFEKFELNYHMRMSRCNQSEK